MTSGFAGAMVGLVGALLLAGCASGADAGASAHAETGSTPSKVWDAATWKPTEVIEPVLATEPEKEAAYREQMDRLAESGGTPEILQVQRKDWSTTPLESDQKVASCMRADGFPVEVSPTGGLRYSTPPAAQARAWALAMNTCIAQHPVDPSYTQDWSEPQLRLVYDYWDQYLIPCLEAQGFTVDTSTRPSKESFVTAFFTPGRHDWWPLQATMRGVPQERQTQVVQTCPELPPQDVFWGTSG